ncbi:MAG: hypothetical protein K5657_04215 [Desulfovibrio sp.]|nr:hypothetical protein [Desulfovibrio sp.]
MCRSVKKTSNKSRLVLLLVLVIFIVTDSAKAAENFFEVKDSAYRGNPSQKYPLFKDGNQAAARKINSFTEMIIPDLIQSKTASYKEQIYVNSSYKVTLNSDENLSILFSFEYGLEGWPQYYSRGYVFDSKTGNILHLRDLPISINDVKAKLALLSKKKGIPISKHINFQELTENFYCDDDYSVHFIFNKGSIAPEAFGIIDLNMNED